jgi:hypothetical protein
MQSLLTDKGWDCAECIELNVWAKVLKENDRKFARESLMATVSASLSKIFSS